MFRKKKTDRVAYEGSTLEKMTVRLKMSQIIGVVSH